MVTVREREDGTWYECDVCGLLLDDEGDARRHEETCEDEDPPYLV